jgi:predicted aspartyl protease
MPSNTRPRWRPFSKTLKLFILMTKNSLISQCIACVLGLSLQATATATESLATIPMHEKGAKTYYIHGAIEGFGDTEFMVDTGSGYVTINEHTLNVLQASGGATYVRDLLGVFADGQRRTYPVYRLASIRLGENCELHDVEAAVFPGRTRHILGLSGLKQAGSFTFSFKPPQLRLANCGKFAG